MCACVRNETTGIADDAKNYSTFYLYFACISTKRNN